MIGNADVEVIEIDAVDPEHAETQEFSGEKKKILFDAMKRLGITAIKINFNGGGDSGQIEEILYNGLHQSTVDLKNMTVTGVTYQVANGQTLNAKREWVDCMEEKTPSNMYDLVEEMGYDILNKCPYDWCNNDGGFGAVYIFHDSEGDHIRVDMNVNSMSSENFPIVVQ